MPDFTDDELEAQLRALTPAAPDPQCKDRILAELTPAPVRPSFFSRRLVLPLAASLLLALAGTWWARHATLPSPVEAPAPLADLKPIYSSQEVAESSLGDLHYVEGLGWIQPVHYQLTDQTLFASEDQTTLYAASEPREHTVFVTLDFQ